MSDVRSQKFIEMGFDPHKVKRALQSFPWRDDDYIAEFLSHPMAREGVCRRSPGELAGLKNVGNSCYFNCLLQSYFLLPEFYRLVMELPGTELLRKLQKVFAQLTASNSATVNPGSLLRKLGTVDLEQKDIGEFNLRFIDALEQSIERKGRESPLFDIFYAEQEQEFEYTNSDSPSTVSGICSQVILDVSKNQEFYAAWETAFTDEVLDTNTEAVNVRITTYLKTLPKVLMFQLNRVIYDCNRKCMTKVHKPFHFPEQLYPARFLLQHKTLRRSLGAKHTDLGERLFAKEEMLQQLTEVDGLGSVPKVMRTAASLISQQVQHASQFSIEKKVLSTSPVALRLLNRIEEAAQSAIDELQKEISHLENLKGSVFDVRPLNTEVYHLHAVLIHDGEAEVGHYYAFIRNGSQWLKFSDAQISVVDQSEVFRQGAGGIGKLSAYWLVYAHPEMLVPQEHNFSLDLDSGDFYTQLIPSEIKEKLREQNAANEESFANEEAKAVGENLISLYEARVDEVREDYFACIRASPADIDYLMKLTSAYVFLKFKKLDRASKWLLLDYCMTESIGRGVLSIDDKDPLYPYLRGITAFTSGLTEMEAKEMHESLEEYQKLLRLVVYMNYASVCVINSEFFSALKAYIFILSNNYNEIAVHRLKVMNSFKTLVYRLVSCMLQDAQKRNFENAIDIIEVLDFSCKCVIEFEYDRSRKQVEAISLELMEQMIHEDLEENLLERIKNNLDLIKSYDMILRPDLYDQDEGFTKVIQSYEQIQVFQWHRGIVNEAIGNIKQSTMLLARWDNMQNTLSRRYYSIEEWLELDSN